LANIFVIRRSQSSAYWGKGDFHPFGPEPAVDFPDQGALDDAPVVEVGNPHPPFKIQTAVTEIQLKRGRTNLTY
jgi:hypothetical protein